MSWLHGTCRCCDTFPCCFQDETCEDLPRQECIDRGGVVMDHYTHPPDCEFGLCDVSCPRPDDPRCETECPNTIILEVRDFEYQIIGCDVPCRSCDQPISEDILMVNVEGQRPCNWYAPTDFRRCEQGTWHCDRSGPVGATELLCSIFGPKWQMGIVFSVTGSGPDEPGFDILVSLERPAINPPCPAFGEYTVASVTASPNNPLIQCEDISIVVTNPGTWRLQ